MAANTRAYLTRQPIHTGAACGSTPKDAAAATGSSLVVAVVSDSGLQPPTTPHDLRIELGFNFHVPPRLYAHTPPVSGLVWSP